MLPPSGWKLLDDTCERVAEYAERVQYFYKPNGGQASAFNFGIAKARGEYVALLDADERMTIQADGLLAALIIFLGPVIAINEPLAVYCIHGTNLYFHGTKGVDSARKARRIETLKVIQEEMDKWLTQSGHNLNDPVILAFRRRWQSLYGTQQFLLTPPGRTHFFWHLLRTTQNMRPCLNARIRLVNWINTVGSLFPN